MTKKDVQRKDLDWSTWKGIAGFAKSYRPEVAIVACTAIATAICDTAFPLITRALIDRVEAANGHAELWPYALAYALVTLILALSVWAFIHYCGLLASHISHDIRRAAFDRLQLLSFSYFDYRPVGWLVARMTSDCDRLAKIVAWGLLDVAWATTLLAAISLAMLVLNWKLALVVLIVVPVLVLVSVYFQKRILSSARLVRKANSLVTAAFNEALLGIRTTKTFGREAQHLQGFQGQSGGLYASSVRNALQSAVYLPMVLTLGSLGSGLALLYGGWQVLGGVLSIGTVVAFMSYARQFFDPVQELAHMLAELQMAQASAERVLELVTTKPEIGDSPAVAERVRRAQRLSLPSHDGGPERFREIEFRDVDFAYATGSNVLGEFDLKLRAGESVALVGATGGGKSTIASLLCRFYEPTSGQVLFDGIDYRERSLAWLESITSVVLQTPHLFRGTVRENIRYGRLAATDAEVEAAARRVAAHEAIVALDRGYDTDVGEGGCLLSVGQKQLVSLARAVVRDPQILVLDEATSSIDPETEVRIQRGLEAAFQGRLSLIIAHRMTTVRSADRILVINRGCIVEEGNHQELMARHGHYYELYSGQSLRETLLHWEQDAAAS